MYNVRLCIISSNDNSFQENVDVILNHAEFSVVLIFSYATVSWFAHHLLWNYLFVFCVLKNIGH